MWRGRHGLNRTLIIVGLIHGYACRISGLPIFMSCSYRLLAQIIDKQWGDLSTIRMLVGVIQIGVSQSVAGEIEELALLEAIKGH